MPTFAAELVLAKLDLSSPTPLNRQLYQALRELILSGELAANRRLPGTRDLAKWLTLSRNTVLAAYEQLQAEGYIYSKAGSGSFVRRNEPQTLSNNPSETHLEQLYSSQVQLSKRAEALLSHSHPPTRLTATFAPSVPDLASITDSPFTRLLARQAKQTAANQLARLPASSATLQQVLADYLSDQRAVCCQPQQILITASWQQSVDLISRMLCNPHDNVWLEEPSPWSLRTVLRMNEVTLHALKVDEQGLQLAAHNSLPTPRIIFTTPAQQYPLGSVMSLSRRQQLLSYAQSVGAWIVEDDQASELRFAGSPIPSLQGLVTDAPVIYCGSLHKSLDPALNLAYIVLPASIAQPLISAYTELYPAPSYVLQNAVAEFIQSAQYSNHLRKMRTLYSQRRLHLIRLIEQHLGAAALHGYSTHAGLDVVITLAAEQDDLAIAQAANEQGLGVHALSKYYWQEKRVKGLVLGFANTPVEQMDKHFMRLIDCINAH